jgi:nicotinamide-nucleotide amidase
LNPFPTLEHKQLAEQIAAALIEKGETIAVAETTTGGLISAALLSVNGASRYYAGGGVLYTLNSRIALAGVSPNEYKDYRGTTVDIILSLASSMRKKLGATWCIAESGLAGPNAGRLGGQPGNTVIGIDGPVQRSEAFNSGLSDREENMVAFATRTLEFALASIEGTSSNQASTTNQ